jgi:hypothetical protein
LQGVWIKKNYFVYQKPLQTGDWKSCVEKVGKKEVRMYDVSLLNSLSQSEQPLSPGLRLRPLQLSDYERGNWGKTVDQNEFMIKVVLEIKKS